MPSNTLEQLLLQLDELKRRFDPQSRAQILKVLAQLDGQRFKDAARLVRFHEQLLFILAYPQSAQVLRRVEKILSSFIGRVRVLIDAGADISPLEEGEVSGISGTSVQDTFSYSITRWLIKRYPSKVSIDWESHEDEYRLAATWPRFIPLLEEDALVEANVPYHAWLLAAKGQRGRELSWLIERFERLPLSEKEKAELYESLKLPVRFELDNLRATRTLMKRGVRKIFYHTEPLLRRAEISLAREFASPPIRLKKLSSRQGAAILELARETSTVRYRELYGFTHGDPRNILHADIGRGVEVFMVGVPTERRLPLRAYHAGLIFKNGVPVSYVEGLTLFGRMEIGFNLYYTFREGESAWIYARCLKIFKEMLGVTVFSIDPYQLGYHNEEGIDSGAFWFYRKLGFRPTSERLTKLTNREERKLAARPSYRTPAKVLRQLSEGHMLLETEPSESGLWDQFRIRKVGLAVQRRMATHFKGDAGKIGRASSDGVARALGVETIAWKESERRAFADLALVLCLIPDLARWTEEEKREVVRIVRAKAGTDEARYVRLMLRHRKLRDSIIKIGS